jgi:general stress protein CsbA
LFLILTWNYLNFPLLDFNQMKIFNIIFAVLFVLFAVLQYNDPDPYIWVPIYLYAAVLCLQASRNKFYTRAYVAGIIVYSLYAVYKIFDTNGLLDWINLHHAENITETMKAEKPWVEESREFFGLLILIAVLSIDLVYARKRKL